MKAVKSDEIWTLDNHALTLFDCTLKSILAELSSVKLDFVDSQKKTDLLPVHIRLIYT